MNAFETIGKILKRTPANMIISVIASLIIGFIGHMFCFTNTLFLHDAAGVYWNSVSFAEAASGSRWLYPIYDYILNSVQLPWLDGVITLLLYGISAWLVCEILNIKRPMAVIIITGLMVLSPTAISSNCYLSSAPIYASALLFSCLAIYAFYNWKWGVVWLFVFALISEGSYAAYIGFSICLFFLRNIIVIIDSSKDLDKKIFKEHWIICVCAVGSLALTFAIMKLLQIGSNAYLQARIADVTEAGITTYIKNIYYTLYDVARTFIPGGYISYMQARTVTYVIFLTGLTASVAVYAKMLFDNKNWKRILVCLMLIVDIVLLPFAMNFLRLITETHTLMQFGFIVPWIFCIQVHEKTLDHYDNRDKSNRKAICAYSWLIALFSISSLFNFAILANTTYAKESVVYESGISLTNRIVDRVESTEEYRIGKTPVVFIGETRNHYAPYHEGFEICDSITGIGSDWWDTSLTYNFPLIAYIRQHLGIDMYILNDIAANGMSMDELKDLLEERDVNVDFEKLKQNINSMNSFPKADCTMYVNDILIFKLSNQED